MAPIFDLRQICKTYDDGDAQVQVLHNLSLQINPAEALVVTGPSGSGKSTLLNVLAGLLEVEAGEIDFCDGARTLAWHQLSVKQRAAVRRRRIGYVHQFFNLIPTLTVAENVELVLQLNGAGAAAGGRIPELLELCGISHRAQAFPEQLSGGEQQRTAVARALVHEPLLVLADEPTGNLDKANAEQVADLLFEVTRNAGAALVVATHSDAVAQRADRELSFASHIADGAHA